jgi:hypothetical protein
MITAILIDMDKKETVSESFMHSVVNDFSSEDLIELGEEALDKGGEFFTKSDVVTKIPVIGILAAFAKGAFAFRERRYVSKLMSFFSETSKASDEDKAKYEAKLAKYPKKSKKTGATILDMVDKFTSAEKAVMAGKIVRAFMHEDSMTFEEVIYLCEIVEKAHLDDLNSLTKGDVYNNSNLEAVGIKKPMRSEDVNVAIQAAIDRVMSKMPIVHEHDEYPTGVKDPSVLESGLTDEGQKLQIILRTYN